MQISRINTGVNQNFRGEFHLINAQYLLSKKRDIAMVNQEILYTPYLHDTDEIQAKEKEQYT